MKIEMLYDYPRLEEKLIIDKLKANNCEVILTNINNKPLQLGERIADVSLVRSVSMYKSLYAAALRESGGGIAVNSSYTILICGDKILTLSKIKNAGLNVPRSIVAMDTESAQAAYRALKKPFVDKPPIGSWGRLVSLVTDTVSWRSLLEHRQMLPSQQLKIHIMQDYIETNNRDIRAIVIGGEVLGAMYRISIGDEWRANIALGGKPVQRKLDPVLEEISIKAAESVKGDFISVDILEDSSGMLYVNEVNGVPEFKGFMEATGIDVASELVKFLIGVSKK
ncbi:MAG: lysine biosynthesis protein LysX [Nitrososphaerota archaeon]